MKLIGSLIDKLEKNHKHATPYMVVIIVLLSVLVVFTMPAYEEYCKEHQAVCSEE